MRGAINAKLIYKKMKGLSLKVLAILFVASLFLTCTRTGKEAQHIDNALPVMSNVSAIYDSIEKQLVIQYDVSDKEEYQINVEVKLEQKGNQQLMGNNMSITGDVGSAVRVGKGKQIRIQPVENPGVIAILLSACDGVSGGVGDLVAYSDTVALRATIEKIYGVRHYSNSEHLSNVRKYLIDEFSSMGYEIILQPVRIKDITGENIVAIKKGHLRGNRKVVLSAHYDTPPGSPGADDNATGIAALLEIANSFKDKSFAFDIEFAAFDLEEYGLVGSRKYVEASRSRGDEIVASINLDMIGYSSDVSNSQTIPPDIHAAFPIITEKMEKSGYKGNFIVCIANTNSTDIKNRFEVRSKEVISNRDVISIVVPENGESFKDLRYGDHAAFWDGGYKMIFVGDGADSRNINYHSSRDTLGTINYHFLGDVTLATKLTLADYLQMSHCTHVRTAVEFPIANP